MCTVLLPQGVNPIAVNKYIYIYTSNMGKKIQITNYGYGKANIRNIKM